MIAAKAEAGGPLGMFRVILSSSMFTPEAQISSALQLRATEILRSASAIAKNPTEISSSTTTEAIELALRIMRDPSLADKAAQVQPGKPIPADVAAAVLASLNRVAA